MKVNLELTETEANSLQIIVAHALHEKDRQRAHANSHACDFDDPHHAPLQRIWEKLNER